MGLRATWNLPVTRRIVIFDTNVVPRPTTIGGPFWDSVLRLCALTEHTAALPDIVVHEAKNLYREQLAEAADRLATAHRKFAALSEVAPQYIPSPDAMADEWEAQLREVFEVLDSDGADAAEALRREALRLRPAREGKGARDSIIWLTALRLAKTGDTVRLVSRNTHDFGGEGEHLHGDLLTELQEAEAHVEYHPSLDAFISDIAEHVSSPSVQLDSAPGLLLEAALSALPSEVELSAEDLGDELTEFERTKVSRSYKVDDTGLVLIDGELRLSDGATQHRFETRAWVTYSIADGDVMSIDFVTLDLPQAGAAGAA